MPPRRPRPDGDAARLHPLARHLTLPVTRGHRLDVLDEQTRGKGLLELLRLVGVVHAQGVEVLGAPHLELGLGPGLLDLHRLRILATGGEEEILDLVDLLGLWMEAGWWEGAGRKGSASVRGSRGGRGGGRVSRPQRKKIGFLFAKSRVDARRERRSRTSRGTPTPTRRAQRVEEGSPRPSRRGRSRAGVVVAPRGVAPAASSTFSCAKP